MLLRKRSWQRNSLVHFVAALLLQTSAAGQSSSAAHQLQRTECKAEDLQKWQSLPREPSEDNVRQLAAIFRACRLLFVRPEAPDTWELQRLHRAALDVSTGASNLSAVEAEVPLRGGRRVWLPSPHEPAFDENALICH